MKVAALGIFCPPAPPLRLSGLVSPGLVSPGSARNINPFGTEKRPLPYQTARQGGFVQKTAPSRTKPHGMEVRYRKAAFAVPNRTAGRFRTENGPIPYRIARQDRIFANLTRVFEGEPIFMYLYNTYIKNYL